jgi:hypothetical protein
MKKNVLILILLVIIAALFLPKLLGIIGALTGLTIGLFAGIGGLLLTIFVLIAAFSGTGLLVFGILGLVGVILLAIALPLLAPFLFVIIPVIIIIKLLSH